MPQAGELRSLTAICILHIWLEEICNSEKILFVLNEFIVGHLICGDLKCSEWGFLLNFAIIGHVSMEIQGFLPFFFEKVQFSVKHRICICPLI